MKLEIGLYMLHFDFNKNIKYELNILVQRNDWYHLIYSSSNVLEQKTEPNASQKVLNRSKLIQMIKNFAIFNTFDYRRDI